MTQYPPPYPPPYGPPYAPPFAPPFHDQRKTDDDHLKLLSILHFVGAGLSLLGILGLFLHYTMFQRIMSDSPVWQNKNQPMPQDFLEITRWIYVGLGAVYIIFGLLNLATAMFIRARKHRLFCLIVSGANCLHVPLGTALGVFTIIVLVRDSVRRVFEESAGSTA